MYFEVVQKFKYTFGVNCNITHGVNGLVPVEGISLANLRMKVV